MSKKKVLLDIVSGCAKQFGKGTVLLMGDEEPEPVHVIHTGSIGLDHALGVGGLPSGRIVELFGNESGGKTTMALHAIAEAQRAGSVAAFIDAEHSLDLKYASDLGVNVDDLLLCQPDCGEQALEVADTLVRTNEVGIIVIDSVAALVPRAELEGEMGDTHVGLQARLMSQALRKLTAIVGKNGVLVIFINQIRMKIGVMYGCFQYGARVTLADGGSEKIGKIVNQKLPVEVMSFDPSTGRCCKARVTGWHDNGNADGFLQFVVEGVGGSGRATFGVTPNHLLFVPVSPLKGGPRWIERAASELKAGDMLGHRALHQFTSLQRQLAIGSVLGDGNLRREGRHLTRLRLGHGPNQIDYARWKEELLGGCVAWSGPHSQSGGWSIDCRPSADLNELQNESYDGRGGRTLSKKLLNDLTLFAVAIWALDDGSFSGSYEKWGHGKFEISTKSYTVDERERLAVRLEELGCGRPTVRDSGTLLWSGERTHKLMDRIAQFVPPCMEYKLHPLMRGKFVQPEDVEQEDRYEMVPVPIIDIYEKPPTRSMRRFDITVDGNHTYLVDGVAVHNSPETTTGGNALKFYASVRLDVRRIGTVKEKAQAKKGDEEEKPKEDKSTSTGNRTRVKVVKNKCAPPFREAEFDLIYGVGIDTLGELVDLGSECGVVEKNGVWYALKGERIGQGRENAKNFLREHREIADALREEVITALKNQKKKIPAVE